MDWFRLVMGLVTVRGSSLEMSAEDRLRLSQIRGWNV